MIRAAPLHSASFAESGTLRKERRMICSVDRKQNFVGWAWAVVVLSVISGCSAPGSHRPEEVVPPVARLDTSLLLEGERCRFDLVRPYGSDSCRSIEGTITRVADDHIALTDAVTTDRTESSTPILGDIPYVNRHFKHVGVGAQDHATKEIRVPITRIASIELI